MDQTLCCTKDNLKMCNFVPNLVCFNVAVVSSLSLQGDTAGKWVEMLSGV